MTMNDRIQYLGDIRNEYQQLFDAIKSFTLLQEDITIVLTDFFEKLDINTKKVYFNRFCEDFANYRKAYIDTVDSILDDTFEHWYDHVDITKSTPFSLSLKEIQGLLKAAAESKLELNISLFLDSVDKEDGGLEVIIRFPGSHVKNIRIPYEIEKEWFIHDDIECTVPTISNYYDIINEVDVFLKHALSDYSWSHVERFINSFSLSTVRDTSLSVGDRIKWLGSVSEFARLFFDLASNTKVEFPFSSHTEDQSNWLLAKQLLQAFDVRKSDGKPVEINYLRTALDRARDKEMYSRKL